MIPRLHFPDYRLAQRSMGAAVLQAQQSQPLALTQAEKDTVISFLSVKKTELNSTFEKLRIPVGIIYDLNNKFVFPHSDGIFTTLTEIRSAIKPLSQAARFLEKIMDDLTPKNGQPALIKGRASLIRRLEEAIGVLAPTEKKLAELRTQFEERAGNSFGSRDSELNLHEGDEGEENGYLLAQDAAEELIEAYDKALDKKMPNSAPELHRLLVNLRDCLGKTNDNDGLEQCLRDSFF